MASQAAMYVHAIALLTERAEIIEQGLADHPDDASLLEEQAGLARSLRLFHNRLRRTEEAVPIGARAG